MKTKIKLSISQDAKIMVDEGDKLDEDTVIANIDEDVEKHTIELAKLLKIKPSKVNKYLIKKIDEEIAEGDKLAEKKGIFSSLMVKSPISGKITTIDLKEGTVTISEVNKKNAEEIKTPAKGKVKKIDKDYIEIEFDGEVIKAEKGQGIERIGQLEVFSDTSLDMMVVDDAVAGKIVFAEEIDPAVLTKLDVVDAVGVIVVKEIVEEILPWIKIDKKQAEKLKKKSGKKVWLRPEEKQIIIL